MMINMMMMMLTSPEEGPSRGWLSRSPISLYQAWGPEDDSHEQDSNVGQNGEDSEDGQVDKDDDDDAEVDKDDEDTHLNLLQERLQSSSQLHHTLQYDHHPV